MTIYVSVNKHIVAENFKTGRDDPAYELRRHKHDTDPVRVKSAEFIGRVKLMYDKEDPLISGAACWLEIDELC